MRPIVTLLARVLIAAIFLVSGVSKIFQFASTQSYMASHGMGQTGLFLAGAIALEVLGGLSLVLGYKTRWGALALIVLLVPATYIFHLDLGDRNQQIQLLKNLAILGGLLMVASHGPGPHSMDGRRRAHDA